MLTHGSLFAGIGGFDLGFERAGIKTEWQVENDDYARRILRKHWPDCRLRRDIRHFPPRRGVWAVDIISAGFPCQDISFAGKGMGLRGERSGLFYEAARVIRELAPRVVVLENVAALLVRGLPEVLGTLVSFGYDCEWHCLPALAVGAPHIRDRVFVIAYADGAGPQKRQGKNPRPAWAKEWPEPIGSSGDAHQSARSIGAGEVAGVSESGANSASLRRGEVADGPRANGLLAETCEGRLPESGGGSLRGGGFWEFEPGVRRVVDGVPSRVDRLRCLGNAVVPQIAEWIGRRIVEVLDAE